MTTAQDVLDYARVYLNDTPGNQWNNDVLLPYLLKLAWDEVGIELQIRDIMVMDEVSAVIPVNADLNILDPPVDLITPFSVSERPEMPRIHTSLQCILLHGNLCLKVTM